MREQVAKTLPDALPNGLASLERIERRLQVVALKRSGFPTPQIRWLTGCDAETISQWHERFEKDGCLLDAPRAGRPRRILEEARLKAVAFYCQASPVPGCGSWSLAWAEEYLDKHPEIIGTHLSRSSLHRILLSHPLKPHLHKYFMQITDPDFFRKMEIIIEVYKKMPQYFFLFDECPNLQALKRKDPPMDATENHPNYESHDYARHGTLDLLAFLQPKTGEVFGRCTSDHKTDTLISVFKEHVATQPEKVKLHYLMDNLSPHYHNDFCETVAELSGVQYHPLHTGIERRQWLQSTDKRIVVYFTPFHGSWLNMVEIWFGIFQQKCTKHVDFHSVEELHEAIEDFIRTWNLYFKHPFTWKYGGEGLHGKAVRRFVRLLLVESRHMDAPFIANQCLLMNNLIQRYRQHVPEKDWKALQGMWHEKEIFATKLVLDDPGPKRRQRAIQAISALNQALASLN